MWYAQANSAATIFNWALVSLGEIKQTFDWFWSTCLSHPGLVNFSLHICFYIPFSAIHIPNSFLHIAQYALFLLFTFIISYIVLPYVINITQSLSFLSAMSSCCCWYYNHSLIKHDHRTHNVKKFNLYEAQWLVHRQSQRCIANVYDYNALKLHTLVASLRMMQQWMIITVTCKSWLPISVNRGKKTTTETIEVEQSVLYPFDTISSVAFSLYFWGYMVLYFSPNFPHRS